MCLGLATLPCKKETHATEMKTNGTNVNDLKRDDEGPTSLRMTSNSVAPKDMETMAQDRAEWFHFVDALYHISDEED